MQSSCQTMASPLVCSFLPSNTSFLSNMSFTASACLCGVLLLYVSARWCSS